MLDILFVVVTLLFFIVAAGTSLAASGSGEAPDDHRDRSSGCSPAVGLLVYLIVALLRPERF